jgi:predicted Rossmann-fold nucleotide-binding protein
MMGKEYWEPMVRFIRETMIPQKTIDPADIDRIFITDSPAEAAEVVRKYCFDELGFQYMKLKRPKWFFFERDPSRLKPAPPPLSHGTKTG